MARGLGSAQCGTRVSEVRVSGLLEDWRNRSQSTGHAVIFRGAVTLLVIFPPIYRSQTPSKLAIQTGAGIVPAGCLTTGLKPDVGPKRNVPRQWSGPKRNVPRQWSGLREPVTGGLSPEASRSERVVRWAVLAKGVCTQHASARSAWPGPLAHCFWKGL